MQLSKICIFLAVLMATGLASVDAEASHKSWLMKNSAGTCVRQAPTANDVYPGFIQNYESFGVYVTCPVTLAARSGSSSPYSSRKSWVAAKQARIHYNQANSSFWCQARAVDTSGGVYYSRGRWSDGTGVRSIELIDLADDWGGTLEAVEAQSFNQLDIECRVGSRNPSNYNPAELYGVDVATCQNFDVCTTPRVDEAAGSSWVQGSGIECSTSYLHSVSQTSRGVNGFRNASTQNWNSVHCPITPGTDDSYEHPRTVYNAFLYYSGSAPDCVLVAWDRFGTKQWGNYLIQDTAAPNRMRHAGSFNPGVDRSMAFECHIPPSSYIIGWSAKLSTTRNSGGQ